MPAISGIDWAANWHDVRVADTHTGALIVERRFAHDEAGISGLIDLLIYHRVQRVAIERPEGLLVGRLLAAGIPVIAIHPNQVAAARDRFRAAAGKSDRFDAFVICELCRTDSHRFAALAPSGDETVALRTLVRTREDLVAVRVHLANQLRAQLDASWPGAARIFADVDSQIGLAFLARYPTPDSLAADAGQAPVAKESGKRRHATFRWACDKRLRSHFATLAGRFAGEGLPVRAGHPGGTDAFPERSLETSRADGRDDGRRRRGALTALV